MTQKAIYSIIFENPTPEELTQAGFFTLVNLHEHFSKGTKLDDYIEGTTYKDIPRVGDMFIQGNRFEHFIAKNTDTYEKERKQINDRTFFRQFMAKEFLEAVLDDQEYLNYNKLYCHQGAFYDNMHEFISPEKPLFIINPKITYSGITINDGIQSTTVTSNALKVIIPFDDNQTYSGEPIVTNKDEPFMEITSIYETNLKEKSAQTVYLKLDIFDERVKEAYLQHVKPGIDRKRIEDIIKDNITLDHSLTLNISSANAFFSIYNKTQEINQLPYLNSILNSLKAYEEESEEKIAKVNHILDSWHKAIDSKEITTITNAQLYAAQLQHGMLNSLKFSDNKKYQALYNKGEKTSTQNRVIAVLNSYATVGRLSFFSAKKPHMNEITGLMDTLNNADGSVAENNLERKIDENLHIRSQIIDTIAGLDSEKAFDSQGELAKVTNFLVSQLDDEIVQLTSELENSNDFAL